MGHNIRAFLGENDSINSLAKNWRSSPVQLSQGLSMLLLTDKLFDDITESVNIHNTITIDGFTYLTSSIMFILEKYSQNGKLAYFETDYFGGTGTQSAVIFENGILLKTYKSDIDDIDTATPSPDRFLDKPINTVLRQFGVIRMAALDEFDTLGLGNYRNMPDDDG